MTTRTYLHDDQAAQSTRLRQFLTWNIIPNIGGTALLFALYLAYINPVFLVMGIEIAGNIALLLWARNQAARGQGAGMN